MEGLVPALLGYIDRAREKQYVLEAKSALTAAQAELSSVYGEGGNLASFTDARKTSIKNTADTPAGSKFTFYTGKALANDTKAIKDNHLSYTVTGAVYTNADGDVFMAFNGSSWVGYDNLADATAAAKTKGITEIEVD